MRRCALLALLWAGTVSAQAQGQPSGSLFTTVRPEAYVIVRKHETGADVVDVRLQKPDYPADLLQKQIEELGRILNSPPRGLMIRKHVPDRRQPDVTFPSATFGMANLIDRERSVLNLEAIAKAFAGAPDPYTIQGLHVQYESEAPTAKHVRWYKSEAVELEALASPQVGLEYRIKLKTQDPQKIRIPEGDRAKEAAKPKPPPKEPEGPDWLMISLFGVAAIAIGALVYSLLLRPRPRPSSR